MGDGDVNQLDPNAIPLALSAVGVIVWLIRLEGRVNTHAQRFNDLKDDVQYIRERIDRALNGRDGA